MDFCLSKDFKPVRMAFVLIWFFPNSWRYCDLPLKTCYLCHILNNYGTNSQLKSNFPRLGLYKVFRCKKYLCFLTRTCLWEKQGLQSVLETLVPEFWIHSLSFHCICNALVENKAKKPNNYSPKCQSYIKKLQARSVLWWSTVLSTSVFTWRVTHNTILFKFCFLPKPNMLWVEPIFST